MEQAAFAIKVAEKVIGEGNVQQQHRVEIGAEDFAHMLNKRPAAYLFLYFRFERKNFVHSLFCNLMPIVILGVMTISSELITELWSIKRYN